MSNTATRIIKNTGWLYAKMAITMFVSIYTTRLILLGLGAADFGIYNLVGGAIGMLGFINASMANSTQRFMNFAEGEGKHEKKVNIYNVSITLHLCVAFLVALILSIAGYFFFNGILNIQDDRQFAAKFAYGCFIVSTVFTVSCVPFDAILNSHENMKFYSVVGVFESVLKLFVAFACIHSPSDKLICYAILMAIIPLSVCCIKYGYCHKNYSECRYSPHIYYDKTIAIDMVSFAGWGFLTIASSMLTMQGMSVLLNMFGGVVVNAAHAIANQLSGQLLVFSNNMLGALNPVLVKNKGAGKNEQMLEAASTGNKLSFLIFSFFTIPFIVETPYILHLWLQEVPEWTVLFVRLVLIREMINQIGITFFTCINATGRIKNMTIISSIIWISPLLIGFFLYKNGAPIYTIYLLLIIMSFFRIFNNLYFCKVQCGLLIRDYFIHTILPCSLQVILLFSVLLLFSLIIEQDWLRLLLVLTLTLTIHPTSSYFFVLNNKERSIINTLFQRVISLLRDK